MLQAAQHWRWLAKQDMKKWILKRISESNPRYDEFIKSSEKMIIDFSNQYSTVSAEYDHLKQAEKILGIKSYPAMITKEMSDGRIYEEFPREEDGELVKRVTDYKAKAIREQAHKEWEETIKNGKIGIGVSDERLKALPINGAPYKWCRRNRTHNKVCCQTCKIQLLRHLENNEFILSVIESVILFY